MAKPNYTDVKGQQRLDQILGFCVALGRDMMVSGANLERAELAIERVCHAYGLKDVSIFMLSKFVTLSARDKQDRAAVKQLSIPPAGIHLQRLKQLNRLAFTVAAEKPAPGQLAALLTKANEVQDYPDWVILLAQMAGMTALCLMFGGGPREILPVLLITALVHYVQILLGKPGLDRIVSNAVIMFAATLAALGLMATGISQNGAVILITVSMLVIPGIPLVNAVRNLLCENEMNGIWQLAKVTIETLALGAGIYVALWLCGLKGEMSQAVISGVVLSPWALLLLSILASASFGIVFRIPPHDLWRAALGGLLTRIALLALTPYIQNRLILTALAALVASLYAEMMAVIRKDPSTYFSYPSIVPLIPGDLFYYTLVGMYTADRAMFEQNAITCLQALVGMSIGFVLAPIITHYLRKKRHKLLVARDLAREAKEAAELVHQDPAEPAEEESYS